MKKKCLVLILFSLIFSICLASCDLNIRDDSEEPSTTPMTSWTTPYPDITTAAETSVAESTTTAPTTPISTEKIVFEKDEPYLDIWRCSFLLQAEKAFIFDNSIRDGLQAQAEFTETELPEGTVMADLNEFRPDNKLYPGKTLFILPDDRCVFFEQSTSDSGEPVYNGKPAKEFLRSQEYYNYDICYYEDEPKVVENYELLPNTPLDPSIAPQNIIINVDWNGDGKTDTILREYANADNTWEQTVWFTDGSTGNKTDITDCFYRDDYAQFNGLTDRVMLLKDEKTGQYALIDSFHILSGDYSIFVYSYDQKSIVTCTYYFGFFAYENGKLYVEYGSFIFGNRGAMRMPLVFDGKNVQMDPTIKEFWWQTALQAEENGETIPAYFSYTLKEVPVEKKIADGYEEVVIPAGIAVFPKYYTWNDDNVRDAGILYFVLADGSKYRISFEVDSWWDCTFSGVPQDELFFWSWADHG